MNSTSRRFRKRGVVLALGLLVTTACGSEDAADGTGTADSGASGGQGVEQAEAFAEENTQNPTAIGLDVPLSKNPEAGKTIISLQNPTPSTFALEAGMEQAAKALGWTFDTVAIETGTEGIVAAFTSALAKKPDGIRVSGQPRQQYEAQIAEAERQGVVVVQDSGTDEPGGGLVSTTISGPATVERYGEVMANYVVADSGGDAKIALFNIPQFPILTAYAESFTETVGSLCPGCEIETVDQQLADIGVNTPGRAVSTMQSSPDTGYLVFTLGDLSNGVTPALRSAGLGDDVALVGSVPTLENLKDLKEGGNGAWTGFAAPVAGWRVMDVFARHFNGDPLDAVESNPGLPTQLITSENVDSIVNDPTAEDWYVGVEDYKEQFKRLWLVE